MTNKTFSIGQLGDYEIKQLKIFKTVVECGGFAAAETRLNISRPTISIHIAMPTYTRVPLQGRILM